MKKSCTVFFASLTALLGTFGILLFCLPQRAFSENENRTLATFQPPTLSGILDASVQENLMESADDQFFGRDFWVKLSVCLKRTAGLSDAGSVYFGSSGCYFERVLDSQIPDSRYRNSLRCIEQFALQQDTAVTFLPVPSAGIIMQDQLPANAVLYNAERLYEQAAGQLKQAGLLDIRPDLTAACGTSQVYFKTDHHWTMEGAFLAYAAWCRMHKTDPVPLAQFAPECISRSFYGTLYSKAPGFKTQPDLLVIPVNLPSADVTIDGTPASGIYSWEKLNAKDKYGIYFGGNFGRIDIQKKIESSPADAGEKTLLVIKDSFANSMVPFLMADYDKIIMLDFRYFNDSVTELLQTEQPDETLVLYELSNFAQDINFYKLLK